MLDSEADFQLRSGELISEQIVQNKIKKFLDFWEKIFYNIYTS